MGIHRDDPEAPDPIYDDAREHLYQRSVVDAVRQADIDVLELPGGPGMGLVRGGDRCRVPR